MLAQNNHQTKITIIATVMALASVLSSACTGLPRKNSDPIDSAVAATGVDGEDTAAQRNVLTFVDSEGFDRLLARKLANRVDSIEIGVVGDSVTVNNLPPRLSKWISAVQENGDGLEILDDSGMRPKNAFSVISLLLSGYDLMVEQQKLQLASGYQGRLHLDAQSGALHKLELLRL